jgi:phage gpG-like protein
MIEVEWDISGFASPKRLQLVREAVGKALYRQSVDRILTGGDDEITFVPLRFSRPDGSTGKVLHPTGKHLLDHMDYNYDATSAWVETQGPGARVHQLGTIGKSAPGIGQGELPTIKPVFAKALFIPLSVKAASMTSRDRNMGVDARAARETIKKLAGKTDKKSRDRRDREQAKLDQLKSDRAGSGLEYGRDFLLLQKVDLPPRPYFRLSKKNGEELARVVQGLRPGQDVPDR